MKTLLAVHRAERYSPNSIDRDRAIICAVADRLAVAGFAVSHVGEDSLPPAVTADAIISMARSHRALDILSAAAGTGVTVVNRPDAVMKATRSGIDALMRTYGLPAAPPDGCDGYWLKRGDEAAQERGDVVFAADKAERDAALARFAERGVADVVVTAHVTGDLVKFYGVAGTGFFRTYYPAEGGFSKFGDESVNGVPHGYAFSAASLQTAAERLASLTRLDVYGGDCVVKADGSFAIIDFNDWPSFSRCRAEAADAVAGLVTRRACRHAAGRYGVII